MYFILFDVGRMPFQSKLNQTPIENNCFEFFVPNIIYERMISAEETKVIATKTRY